MTTVPNYNSQFLERTSKQRNDMLRRGRAEYSKDGRRLLKPANPVEFSLAEYRAWVIAHFGSERGAVPCAYNCGAWISPSDFIPDHIKPLNRGGLNTLENLCACCVACNDAKGELEGPWFDYLLRCLATMPPGQAAMILERLRKSEKAASSVRMLRGRLAASHPNPKPPEVPIARP